MKTKYFSCLAAIAATPSFSSCYRARVEASITCSKLYKTNVIGIAGEPSETPYVEITYSADDGNGKNVTQNMMVSPPYIFGDKKVNVIYDSIVWADKGGIFGYDLRLKRSYEEGGADYFRIVNHSADKPIEFFLAGAQDVNESDDKLGDRMILPEVYYRHAPIYYLLYPDKKYHKNVVTQYPTSPTFILRVPAAATLS
jgi:hypothetical protein